MKRASLSFLVIILVAALYATAPVVTNAAFAQRTDGSKIVDITYDVACTSGDSVYVSLSLSNNGGSSFSIIPTDPNLSGDKGKVQIGTNKHIIWNAGSEVQPFDGNQFAFKVQAWDIMPVPANFVLVTGGTFNNGTSDVTVSSFYMDKYEITQSSYQAVMGSNPASGHGEGADYPVYYIRWFDAIEYCNRRSILEGLAPCYSYSTCGTNPSSWTSGWNNDYNNHTNVSCSWSANGYRLLTEAEWQYAALGGNQTQNYIFSGSNVLDEVCWYYNNSDYSTHLIGTKTANELGIYDMMGNVWEWCWDIYGSYPTDPQINPTGFVEGDNRILRGFSWDNYTSQISLLGRSSASATHTYNTQGFRVCRIAY